MTGHPYTRRYEAPSNPTVNDDINDGHEIGDVWINESTGAIFDCKSTTAGAAVWTERGGAISTGTLDARYLRLDTSNDPLQDGLAINATGTSKSGIQVTLRNAPLAEALEMRQFATTGTVIAAPFIYGLRQASDFSPVVFNNPMLKFEQSASSGTISGGFLQFSHNSSPIILMHPSLGGANVAYSFDTIMSHTPTGVLFELKNNGTNSMHVDGSGTVHSNGVPLIKEAPATSIPYVRRNRGWEPAYTGTVAYQNDAIGTFLAATVPASTTYYSNPFKTVLNATGNTIAWPVGGTLSNLLIRTPGGQPASGSLVVTLTVNTVDTALTVTVPAGQVAAVSVEDTTHTVAINAGDLLQWKVANNATATSCSLTFITMRLKTPITLT